MCIRNGCLYLRNLLKYSGSIFGKNDTNDTMKTGNSGTDGGDTYEENTVYGFGWHVIKE